MKKVKKTHVLKCWMFSFEGRRPLLKLRRPSWRPGDKKLQFKKKKLNFYSAVKFTIFIIKTLDQVTDPDPH
jgi:hypothetical protein